MAWHYAYSQDLWPAMISVALLKLTIVSRRSRWPVAFMLLGLLSGRSCMCSIAWIIKCSAQVNQFLSSSAFHVPFVEIMPSDAGIELESNKIEQTKSEIKFGEETEARYYSLGLTHLRDKNCEALGHLLLLHDTTCQKRSQLPTCSGSPPN